MHLHNIYSSSILENKLREEAYTRIILSFYRYITIKYPKQFRDELYKSLFNIKTLGRIYIANEGINAQISIPENCYGLLRKVIDSFESLKSIYFNRSVIGRDDAFLKLKIKYRKKIVNDDFKKFDISRIEQNDYVVPEEFNRLLTLDDTVVIDLRNNYESEIGHFKKAICLPVKTYREALKELPLALDNKQDKTILLYCTGGIRCEKANIYLKDQGFSKVYQLRGGIINYFREVIENNLPSLFIGKNFVFDQRLGEKISKGTISYCHQCNELSDDYTNCANEQCHCLMIQCSKCAEKYKKCCSNECRELFELPKGIQKLLRQKNKVNLIFNMS